MKFRIQEIFFHHLTTKLKWKAENITLTEQFKTCNRKVVERGKFDTCTPNIHLHDRSLSWHAWYRHFKECYRAKLVLWATPPLFTFNRSGRALLKNLRNEMDILRSNVISVSSVHWMSKDDEWIVSFTALTLYCCFMYIRKDSMWIFT